MDHVIVSLRMKKGGLFIVSLIMMSCSLILRLWDLLNNNKVRTKTEQMKFNKLLVDRNEFQILLKN